MPRKHEIPTRGRAPRRTWSGPVDRAQHAVDQLGRGTRGLEIEVLLGIERGALDRTESTREPTDRVGRRVAGIVPTLECRDHHRPPQLGLFVPADGHVRTLCPRAYDRVPKRAEPVDRDLDDIAVLQPARRYVRGADTRRRTGEDHVTRCKGHALCDPRDQPRNREHEVCSRDDCITSPFSRVSNASPLARSTSSSETTSGPSGQNVSNDFDHEN